MTRNFWMSLLIMFAIVLIQPVMAQPAGQGNDPTLDQGDEPVPEQGFKGQRPGMGGQQGHGMRPGMGPQEEQDPGQEDGRRKGPMDPEREKQMEQRKSMMAMAEAHKQLSLIYEQQGKIDDAAGELKKILTLISSETTPDRDPERERQRLSGKLVPVYHEIARLYLQNNRLEDAEKIVNEGITRFADDNPAAATRLLLHLGEIYKNSKNLDKAAENYKRVIEMNQKILNKK
ncbi:MAG: tetratricopeptide repeat protein [Candidatus Riflebacteria bacterium]|nr:tetratricopeptide repeat protein [Candidatus Riflebacteria bacterium]